MIAEKYLAVFTEKVDAFVYRDAFHEGYELFLCTEKSVDIVECFKDRVLHYFLGVELVHHDVETCVVYGCRAEIVHLHHRLLFTSFAS